MRHGILLLSAVSICTASSLGAQEPRAGDLLTAARYQIAHRQLDSAAILLDSVTSSQRAANSERAEAFMWLGVVRFFNGQDTRADSSFRAALSADPLVMPGDRLKQLDSSLATMWETDQTAFLCGAQLPAWFLVPGFADMGPLNAAARTTSEPRIVSGPQIEYPENLRMARVQGDVIARAIIDTVGRAELGSVRVVATAHQDFNSVVVDYVTHTRFKPATSGTQAVPSCVVLSVIFRVRG